MSYFFGIEFTKVTLHILLTFIGVSGLVVAIVSLLDMRDMPRDEPNVGSEEA